MIMWFANFFVAASATMVLPFLSLYIETFGNYSDAYVQRWSGYIFGITFLVAFFVGPLWGKVGDRFGRKSILVICGFGIALSIFLMGFVESIFGLFMLRLFMGVVTGFIPTAIALVSAQSKKETAGNTLGTLQTGTVGGGLMGPLLGGIVADTAGFQLTFVLTASVIALASLLVTFGVKEFIHYEEGEERQTYTSKEVLRHIVTHPVLLIVMVVALVIQAANFSVQPLLALYVTDLHTAENIAFLSGLAFSITGLGNLIATKKWGQVGDRIGHEKILFLLLLLAALFFIPQAFVSNLWQLIALRFLFGLAIGGLIPCTTAYIRQVCPVTMQGEVLGYNQSFRFLGNVIGPVTGGTIAGMYGIPFVFIIGGFMFAGSAFLLGGTLYRRHMKSAAAGPEREAKAHS
ncbi:putative MFS family arabinose efflux permease [Salsuginibacillus halophilus]|uniref:Putative MFS family arabinose efflux permease n=1 Tax=Salsuginibacillus halophilus TaxID=517424 RepID=A0A2P8HE26_9BACI|nr:MFS transporter [Salsuginibacillus halophilus]PSL44476.1 putative MFS family arabinose efflux permease [Salsuginibacillus halophilus]